MAKNSKREQIIKAIKKQIESLKCIQTVDRKHPEFQVLRGFAPTQLPFVGLVGMLPQRNEDTEKKRFVKRANEPIDSFLSIHLLFFAIAKDDPDEQISFFLDELWRAIHQTPNDENLFVEIQINPELEPYDIGSPYIGFGIEIIVEFLHDKTGI